MMVETIAVAANQNSNSDSGRQSHQWNGLNWLQLGSDINGSAANDDFGVDVSTFG